MIKLLSIKTTSRKGEINYIVGDLYADSKEDVTDSSEIVGLTKNSVLTAGSTLITSAGEVAILNSKDVWNWI